MRGNLENIFVIVQMKITIAIMIAILLFLPVGGAATNDTGVKHKVT